MNFKKDAAAKALTFINDNTTIGLGAGSTMAFLVEMLAAEIKKGLSVKVLTSSFSTRQLLLQNGFTVLSVADVSSIDTYFDGCDQVDFNLNALKSGGGIHTQEKLLVAMAKQFILVVDEPKYIEQFSVNYPLVIEFLPESLRYVPARINSLFQNVNSAVRRGDKNDGPVITCNGNYLLDVYFSKWPEPDYVDQVIKCVTGVVDHSLFYNLAHKIIVAGMDGVKVKCRTGAAFKKDQA